MIRRIGPLRRASRGVRPCVPVQRPSYSWVAGCASQPQVSGELLLLRRGAA